MKLTIIIPTFNASAHIEACLNSILATVGSYLGETIAIRVQDGASTDDTVKIANGLAVPGMEVSVQKDAGVYDAMNQAVIACRSGWVHFLGADDRLLPGFAPCLNSLVDLGKVYYANTIFSGDGRRYDGPFGPFKLIYRNICHQGIFFPRDVLASRPFDLRFPVFADWAKNIELMAAVPYQYLPLDVCLYNNTSGISRHSHDREFELAKAHLFRKHYGVGLGVLSKTAWLPTWVYKTLGHPAMQRCQFREK
ncbi:glycosyltransferase [Pseudohaliea rubra]|uniref:glycosyltransferase n=1 Tax=Pseudohaliea rubra TaxID=475795 RepID=UPI0013768338|nr:glycosyltransferase [Pseudohaliea rubra]